MKSSLFIENWEVDLNSSAQTAMSQSSSRILAAQVRQGAEKFGGETVLGTRILFPTEAWNAWALIRPPFEIPGYANPSTMSSDGRLVEDEDAIANDPELIGSKQIGIDVYGLNFPHSLSIILKDENNEEEEILMGYLDFDGWRTLIWDNPNYIEDVRDRELRSYPLYPSLEPMRKLVGFRVYRDGATQGGDFVTYLRRAILVYDEAQLQLQSDIDHDSLWNILSSREADRRRAELTRVGNQQVLRFIELQLQATEEDLRDQDTN